MTAAQRLATMALACYPPSFRERYAAEIAGLLQDNGATDRTVIDLLIGATRAWSRAALPSGADDRGRRRVQASVTTTWVAWCAGFLIAPSITRVLLDPRPAHVPAAVGLLLGTGDIAAAAGCLLTAVAAMPLLAGAVLPACRRRDTRIVAPLLPLVILLPVEILGMIGIVAWRSGYPQLLTQAHFPPLFAIASLLWLAGFGAMLVSAGLGPAVAMTRAAPSAQLLRAAGLLALPLALLLALATLASSLATVLVATAGGIGGFTLGFAIVILATGFCASAAALVSAGRGAQYALAGARRRI